MLQASITSVLCFQCAFTHWSPSEQKFLESFGRNLEITVDSRARVGEGPPLPNAC